MYKTYEEVLSELPKEEQEAIKAGAKQLREEYEALEALRALLGQNQQEIADYMGVGLEELKEYERIADRYAAAAQEVLENLGGALEMIVRTPDNQVIQVERITDLMPQPPAPTLEDEALTKASRKA